MADQPEQGKSEAGWLRLRSVTPTFTVDDLDRSLRFYADGLGFEVSERWEEEGKLLGVMLTAGSTQFGLSQDDWSRGRDREKGVGFRIWAATEQDLDELAQRLRQKGIEHDGPKTESWGSRTLTVVDPDGFKLTFSSPQSN